MCDTLARLVSVTETRCATLMKEHRYVPPLEHDHVLIMAHHHLTLQVETGKFGGCYGVPTAGYLD